MWRYPIRKFSCVLVLFTCLACVPPAVEAGGASADAVIEGTPLCVRLQSAISSTHSAEGSRVEAIVVQPYSSKASDIPVGSRVAGVVTSGTKRKATLRLHFDSIAIDGREQPFAARVREVDNAREQVEPDGTIVGLDPLRKRPGKVEMVLLAAAHAHPALLVSMETTKYVVHKVDRVQVHYPPGTDMALTVESLVVQPPVRLQQAELPVSKGLARLLNELPNRTEAKHLSIPSDWVNLAFLGSRENLMQAFENAGWHTAAQLSMRTETKTFFAIAEHHAYQSAPVSTLLIGGREPDLVFQKQNNTFAKRHHIRIWFTDKVWDGKPVWIAAATHDIGIEFSSKARTFSHRVDPEADRERLKVIWDLRFTGQASAPLYLSRPEIPRESRNGTGDVVRTDGRLAVVRIVP
jgi:hypothetical protein